MNIGVIGHIDIGRTTAIAAHVIQHEKNAVEIIKEQHEKQIAQHKEFVISRVPEFIMSQPKKCGKRLRNERRKSNRKK